MYGGASMSAKKGLFSKVGKTRIVPIGLKILIIFITIILLSNFANAEVQAFLTAILVIGLMWSGFILIVGMYYIHQFTFGSLLLNLLLTVIGIAIILFLLLLGYSLIQQIITFGITIYNEIVFRL